MNLSSYLSRFLPGVPTKNALAAIELHKEGGTIPFIARYRKEKTGNLDEVQIRDAIEAAERHEETEKRKNFILEEIEKQGQLTVELRKLIETTWDLGDLEELYRPFKKKKKTKATLAREAGLEALADWLWGLGHGTVQDGTSLEIKGKEFLNVPKSFVTYEACLKGAQDILVERISNNADLRALLRRELFENGKVVSKKGKEYKGYSKFEMYADFNDRVTNLKVPKNSHRYLAMRRGWEEGELTVTIEGNLEKLKPDFFKFAVPTEGNQATEFLKNCIEVALSQHMIPSVSSEVHRMLKDDADRHAIDVFASNVRKLLLASPYGSKCVLGVDPGVKTGCKLALIDNSGALLTHTVLTVHEPAADEKAKEMFKDIITRIEGIAVGNGTGGREAQVFFKKMVTDLSAQTPVILVNEAGASVYSASEVAREEFPELDLTVRGAVSIARRLQDPLSELVKIDPKSIGVGQYQHDVSQAQMKKRLDFVVESCVNNVGVDLNTASEYLLRYVSGIGPVLAKNIVEFRKTNGLFADRDSLMKIPQFGSKAYELAAGFLRVVTSPNVLDRTGIHPERYQAVREMAKDLGVPISQLLGDGAQKLREKRSKWTEFVGEFTFDDIVKELEKPGRDPRDPFKLFSYRDDIHQLTDLKESMICPGIVTNVTSFGAFVDIGVHQDGLVHISELSQRFVDDPTKVLSPGDIVTVRVMGVNLEKQQVSLSMRLEPQAKPERRPRPERPKREARPPRPARPPREKSDKPAPPRPERSEKPRRDRPPRPEPVEEKRDMRPGAKGNTSKKQEKGRAGTHWGTSKSNEKKPAEASAPTGKAGSKPAGPRPKQGPLNNPFAALVGLKDNLRKE